MLRGLAVLLALTIAAACGGGSEDSATSPTGSSTPRTTIPRSPTRAPTATLAPAAETGAVTAAPEQTAPPQAVTAVPTPAPTPAPVPVNQAPSFPDPLNITTDTTFEYDDEGYLTGAVTIITIPGASDPDGDPLTYSWSATSGSISGAGLTATWTRAVDFGAPQSGTVTVTVGDGRGGTDVIEIEVQ